MREPFTGLHWTSPYDTNGIYIEPQLTDFKFYDFVENRWIPLVGFSEDMFIRADELREYL